MFITSTWIIQIISNSTIYKFISFSKINSLWDTFITFFLKSSESYSYILNLFLGILFPKFYLFINFLHFQDSFLKFEKHYKTYHFQFSNPNFHLADLNDLSRCSSTWGGGTSRPGKVSESSLERFELKSGKSWDPGESGRTLNATPEFPLIVLSTGGGSEQLLEHVQPINDPWPALNRPTNKSNSIDSGIPYANPGRNNFEGLDPKFDECPSTDFRSEVSTTEGERDYLLTALRITFVPRSELETWGRFSTKGWQLERSISRLLLRSSETKHVTQVVQKKF